MARLLLLAVGLPLLHNQLRQCTMALGSINHWKLQRAFALKGTDLRLCATALRVPSKTNEIHLNLRDVP